MAAAKDSIEPVVVCQFRAISTWDPSRTWYCFESAQIHFFDFESGNLVFRADYFHPDSFLPENTELNRLFIQIRDGFFPDQPNPFRDDPKGPYGPSYRQFKSETY